MRVLLFCQKPPWPSCDGGTVASARLAEGLVEQGVDVEVVALTTPKHAAADEPPYGIELTTVAADTTIRPLPLLVNLVRREPYQLRRFFSREASALVLDRVRRCRPDLVQLDGVGVLPYLPSLRDAYDGVIFYRAQNVEHRIFRARAPRLGGPLTWWWNRQADRLERAEEAACAGVDGIAAVSEEVAQWCRSRASGRVKVIGVGARQAPNGSPAVGRKDLVHLGAMDWWPNRDGIAWFVQSVWPGLRRRHPRLEFHLAGRRSDRMPRAVAVDGVVVDGEIDDAAGYLIEHGVLVVPLRAGSGLRVKIIEAMALGKAIVASPAAVEGIDVEPGRHLLTAANPSAWIHAIDRCLADRDLVAALGAEARRYAETNFSLPRLSRDLVRFYTDAVSANR